MTRKTWFLLSFLVPLAFVSVAQVLDSTDDAGVDTPNGSQVGKTDVPDVDSPRPKQKTPLEGDVVIFKKGSELRGVKVVRQSPMFVEIEYLPGEPYLKIPRGQVSEVIYAQKDDAGNVTDTGLTLGPDIMPGEEVSAEFNHLLTAVLSDKPLEYENEDYLAVIRALCANAGVGVDVDAALEMLPEEARKFSYTVPAGTTLLDFLRKDLAEIAPEMRVILHYDRLILQKRVSPSPLPADMPPPGAPPAEQPEEVPGVNPAPTPNAVIDPTDP